MAIENLYATSHITGSFTTPANAVGSATGTWAGALNTNTSATSRWAMGDPVDPLTTGATQTIRVVARKGSNTGTPTIAINLWENGALVSTILAATNVTSTTGQTLTATFASAAITNRANVEIEIVMTAVGGSGSARNSAQVDTILWEANTTAPSPNRTMAVAQTLPGLTQAAAGTFAPFVADPLEVWADYPLGTFLGGGPWTSFYGIDGTTSAIISDVDGRAWRFGAGTAYVGMRHSYFADGVVDIEYQVEVIDYGTQSFTAPAYLTWGNVEGVETRYFFKATATEFQLFSVLDNVFTPVWVITHGSSTDVFKIRIIHAADVVTVYVDDVQRFSGALANRAGPSDFRCDEGQALVRYVDFEPVGDPPPPITWVAPANDTGVTFGSWVGYNLSQPYPESYVHLGTGILDQFEDDFLGGYQMTAIHHFEGWGPTAGAADFQSAFWTDPLQAWRPGVLPYLTLQPVNESLTDIAAGLFDAYIDQWATTAAAEGTMVWRWGHEMNGTWYSWAGNPANFIAAWQRIVTRTRAIAPNVKFFWCPNINFDGSTNLVDYWPGAEFVDIVGHDGYSFASPTLTWNDVHLATYQTIVALPGAAYKPYWIGETSFPINYGNLATYNQDRYRDYVQSMFDSIDAYPNLRFVGWFSEDKFENGADTDFSINSSGTDAQQSFAAGLAEWAATDPLDAPADTYGTGSPVELITVTGAPGPSVGTAASALPALTQAATGEHTPPAFAAAASSQLPALTQSAAGTSAGPTFDATAASVLPAASTAAAGTSTPPAYAATAAQTLPTASTTAVGASAPPAFTATVASALPAATTQAAGTTAVPVYTAAAASALPALTQAFVGEHVPPGFTVTAVSALPVIEQSASGASGVPQQSGAVAQLLPAATQAATGTTAPPVFAAGVAQTLPAPTSAATGTTAPPVFAGTAAQTLPLLVQGAQGTTRPPVYEADTTQVLPSLQQAAAGASVPPAFTAEAAQTLPSFSQEVVAGYIPPPVAGDIAQALPALEQSAAAVTAVPQQSGSVVQILPGLEQAAAGEHAVPGFTAVASQTLPAAAQLAAGEHAVPTSTGAATSVLPPLTQASTGTTAPPVYSGTASQELPALTQSALALSATPVYAGEISQVLPAATQEAQGEVEVPASGVFVASVLPALAQSATGTHTVPEFPAAASSTLPAATQLAAATTSPPTFEATASSVLPAAAQAFRGTHVVPGEAGGVSTTLPAVIQVGALTHTPPVYGATAGSVLPALTQAATATAALPAYVAAVVQELPALTQAADAAHVPPPIAGTIDQLLPALVSVVLARARDPLTGDLAHAGMMQGVAQGRGRMRVGVNAAALGVAHQSITGGPGMIGAPYRPLR